MFRRAHHQRIARVLAALNSDLLLEAQCYFGGGTAIVLSLDEYRESLDLAMMMAKWGPIPAAAWQKAETAYGAHMGRAFAQSVALLTDTNYLAGCLRKMQMDANLSTQILSTLVATLPPN